MKYDEYYLARYKMDRKFIKNAQHRVIEAKIDVFETTELSII